MALRQTDTLTPPIGMATALDPPAVPRTHAQYMQGFHPARHNKLSLAPLLKRIARNYGLTITGTAIWLSSDGQLDRLLIFTSTKVYGVNLFNAWNYDERGDGQHSYLLPSATLTDLGLASGATKYVHYIQFKTQLLMTVDGVLYRYYRDEPAGTEHFLAAGIATPGAPVISSQSAGGSLTALATYSYLKTFVDELGNESSPSASVSVTLTGGNQTVNLSIGSGTTGGGTGVAQWKIYRKNPGSTTFNLVTTLAIGTTTYADTSSDSTVNAGAAAPSSGENDPPPTTVNFLMEWDDRVLVNDGQNPNNFAISNANSGTQYSSFTVPGLAADGLRVRVGGPGGGQVSGFGKVGSYGVVFTRTAVYLLTGTDSTNFELLAVSSASQVGCQNPYTVQQVLGRLLFLSADGVYQMDGSFDPQKVSDPISDIFKGFAPVAEVGYPTATGRPASIQVIDAIFEDARSFIRGNRYYLAIGNRTLVYDAESGGWSDTGWGYVKTVSHYLSQQSILAGSAPETMFLTLGDINTFGNALYYFTSADTPGDRDAPSSVSSRIVYRPYDPGGQGQVQAYKKRASLVSIYGSTSAAKGEQIGTINFWMDGKLTQSARIINGAVWVRQGALSEASGPWVSGEVGWIELLFTVNDIQVTNVIVEAVSLN